MSGPGPFSLEQAATQTLTYTYLVTTNRTATSLHAELRYADGNLATAWWLQGQAGSSPWSSNGGAIDVAEYATLTQGTSFPVTFIVTAPVQVTQQHSVFLYIRSTASTERGELETGVVDQSAAASFSAVAPITTETESAAGATLTAEADQMGAMSVAEGGTFTCERTAPTGTDAIDVDEFARFSCTYAVGPVRLRANTVSTYWEYRIDGGPWTSVVGQDSLTAASGDGGKNVTHVIDLRFTGDLLQLPPGSQGEVQVEMTNPAGKPFTPTPVSATLVATRATNDVPTADGLELTCIPNATSSAVGGDPIEVACTFGGKDTLGDRLATLTQLLVTSPEGWTVSSEGTASGATLLLTPNESIGAGSAYTFSFFLTPVSCDTDAGTVAISSTIAYDGSGAIDGPAASLTANVAGHLSTTLTASGSPLDFGTSSWNGTEYSAVRGSLTLTIAETDAGACSSTLGNWSIQISTDGLYREDTHEQISANAITYLGAQSTLDVPDGLTAASADIPLAPGVKTTIASGNGLIGGATWNPVFQLNPPNTAPAGAYSGTIRIEVINAP